MCSAEYFSVDYVINPWMTGLIGKTLPALARKQWTDLYQTLNQMARVELIDPRPNLPDQVFTANAGLLHKNIFIPSRFRHRQRRLEEPWFLSWFESHKFEAVPIAEEIFFEGSGDALLQPGTDLLWMGYGFRTDLKARAFLEDRLPLRVLPLRLVDPRFYHLDVCFCPLLDGWAMYYPPAFDAESQRLLEAHIPPEKRIILSEEDARGFACNAVLIGKTLVMNQAGAGLQRALMDAGYRVEIVSVDEFIKAGGANKCLTMAIDDSESLLGSGWGRAA